MNPSVPSFLLDISAGKKAGFKLCSHHFIMLQKNIIKALCEWPVQRSNSEISEIILFLSEAFINIFKALLKI